MFFSTQQQLFDSGFWHYWTYFNTHFGVYVISQTICFIIAADPKNVTLSCKKVLVFQHGANDHN